MMRKAILPALAMCCIIFVCALSTDASRGIKLTAIDDLSHRSGKLGEFKALVIGINDYADPRIPDLTTAVNDARTMAGVLAEKYGFTVERLFDRNATKAAVYSKLRNLAASTRPDDSVLIYFAGHGDLDRVYDDGWWIPSDAAAGNPVTYFSNLQVQKAMQSMKARHVLVISDSCYSGTLFGRSRTLPPEINDKYYLGLYNDKSRWGMTSGNKEPVSDAGSEGHSVFAYQLLKALKRNSSPFISIQEIYTKIAPIISNNSEQTPLCRPIRNTGDQGGEFVFVAAVDRGMPAKKEPIPSAAKPPIESMDKEVVFWQSIQNSNDLAFFQAYLKQYPNGTFASIAKLKLEMLTPGKEVAAISPEDTKPELAPEILKARLFVETEPEGARVRILNIKQKFRQGIELDPGSYHIEIAARGHEIEKQWIKLGIDEERRMSVELARIPETGTIQVSGSPKGAKVYIDGNLAGRMPVVVKDVNKGSYRVRVEADGYLQISESFTIGPREYKTLDIFLKQNRLYFLLVGKSDKISGKKIRAGTKYWQNYVRNNGGTAVAIPGCEAVVALNRGIIDGIIIDPIGYEILFKDEGIPIRKKLYLPQGSYTYYVVGNTDEIIGKRVWVWGNEHRDIVKKNGGVPVIRKGFPRKGDLQKFGLDGVLTAFGSQDYVKGLLNASSIIPLE